MRGWLAFCGVSLATLSGIGIAGGEVLELPLEAAIERALAYNMDLSQGAMEVESQRLEVDRAREEVRGLEITPAGGAEAGGESSLWQAGMVARATGPWGTELSAETVASQVKVDGAEAVRRAEVGVAISQPLFRRFGTLMRNEPAVLAEESLRAVRRVWERERSALVLEVVEAYEELICLRQQVECDEAQQHRLERLAALAEARERRGKSTQTEVLRLNLQRGEAASRLETGRTELAIGFERFARLLGLPLDTAFVLHPPPMLVLDETPPEEAVALALRERPDYAQALENITTGDRQVRIARRALLPDLALTARQSVYGEDADWGTAGQLDDSEWRVGVEGRMNLNVREARLAARRAQTDTEAQRLAAEIMRQRLAVEVHAAQLDYRRTRAEWMLSEQNRGLADRRSELARALFEAGRASADGVSDAEADALSAQRQEIESRRAAAVAAYRLLHVLGTLVPVPEELLMRTPERASR